MKKYDTQFIKDYINKHKKEIESVECGMREDWRWTCSKIYENGEFYCEYDWERKSFEVKGISGSTWATPVMHILLKNGKSLIVPCFYENGEKVSDEQIRNQMKFAKETNGMDYLEV